MQGVVTRAHLRRSGSDCVVITQQQGYTSSHDGHQSSPDGRILLILPGGRGKGGRGVSKDSIDKHASKHIKKSNDTTHSSRRSIPAAVMDSRAARMAGSSLNCRHAVRRSRLSVSPSMRTYGTPAQPSLAWLPSKALASLDITSLQAQWGSRRLRKRRLRKRRLRKDLLIGYHSPASPPWFHFNLCLF